MTNFFALNISRKRIFLAMLMHSYFFLGRKHGLRAVVWCGMLALLPMFAYDQVTQQTSGVLENDWRVAIDGARSPATHLGSCSGNKPSHEWCMPCINIIPHEIQYIFHSYISCFLGQNRQ